jgi:phage I-like protein
MDKHFGWWVDLQGVTLSDGDGSTWIHALPFGSYKHPLHGDMHFDINKLTALAQSVKDKVRGIDPDIDYDHKEDPAKGRQAAGWVKDAKIDTTGLYLKVNLTPTAVSEVKEGKYRYFSAEFADSWLDNQGKVHKDVLLGGGLTNRPYMKNLMPVNLAELNFEQPPKEEDKEVDGKKLREALGLSADTTDEAVFAKLGEIAQAMPKLAEAETKLTEAQAKIAQLTAKDEVDPQLMKLIEGSPAMRKMYEASQAKDKQLAELQQSIRLGEVNAQIGQLQQNDKMALAPVVRDALREVMLTMGTDAAKKLHETVLVKIMDGSGTVDLSEHGYTGRKRTDSDIDPTIRFNDAVKALMEGPDKVDYGTAVERVARENRTLFNEYREANYQFKA